MRCSVLPRIVRLLCVVLYSTSSLGVNPHSSRKVWHLGCASAGLSGSKSGVPNSGKFSTTTDGFLWLAFRLGCIEGWLLLGGFAVFVAAIAAKLLMGGSSVGTQRRFTSTSPVWLSSFSRFLCSGVVLDGSDTRTLLLTVAFNSGRECIEGDARSTANVRSQWAICELRCFAVSYITSSNSKTGHYYVIFSITIFLIYEVLNEFVPRVFVITWYCGQFLYISFCNLRHCDAVWIHCSPINCGVSKNRAMSIFAFWNPSCRDRIGFASCIRCSWVTILSGLSLPRVCSLYRLLVISLAHRLVVQLTR